MRQFLYTWVHEAGHAFNFLHSWDRNRPSALSWMNYDWRYDELNGADKFWSNFRFRFDDEELIHVRHGDRAAVAMGGLTLDPRLNPEYGNVTFFIRRPSGRIVQYAPVMCKSAPTELKVLTPAQAATDGTDRHSASVFLSYGKYGYYFDEPGDYLVRATYQGPGNMVIPSNPLTVRVGRPNTIEDDRLGADFFSYEVGVSLYLYGSRSTRLEKGWNVLQEAAARAPASSMRAVRIRAALANSLAKPFIGLERGPAGKRSVERPRDPEASLATVTPAVEALKSQGRPSANLLLNELARRQATLQAELYQLNEAIQNLTTVRGVLHERGVNPVVLADIAAFANRLATPR